MSELTNAIDALNGTNNTLTQHEVGGWQVMIGGGPEGYLLSASAGPRTANALSGSAGAPGETVTVVLGGQEISGPRTHVLSRTELDLALLDLGAGEFGPGRWDLNG